MAGFCGKKQYFSGPEIKEKNQCRRNHLGGQIVKPGQLGEDPHQRRIKGETGHANRDEYRKLMDPVVNAAVIKHPTHG